MLLTIQPFCHTLVLWEFQQKEGRLPQSSSQDDMDTVLRQRDEKLKAAEVDPAFVDDHLLQYVWIWFFLSYMLLCNNLTSPFPIATIVCFRALVASAVAEIAPVCAIVGGFLAQDILKTLSGKDAPLFNYFLYNGLEGSSTGEKPPFCVHVFCLQES